HRGRRDPVHGAGAILVEPASRCRLRELPLHPVQVQVDLPLVVAAEADPENDVVDLLRGHGPADRRSGKGGLHSFQERVDLIDLVSPAQRPPPEPLTSTTHRSTFRPSARRQPTARTRRQSPAPECPAPWSAPLLLAVAARIPARYPSGWRPNDCPALGSTGLD